MSIRVIILVFLFVPTLVWGQEEWSESGEIESAQVVVEKDRQIELPAAVRNFEKVPPTEIKQEEEPQIYLFNEYSYPGKGYVPRVEAEKIEKEKVPVKGDNYVRFGFGNFISPLGELSLNTQKDKLAAGLAFRHLSFSRGPVDGSSSGSSDNQANLYASLFNQNNVVTTHLDFSSIKRYYYGFTNFSESAGIDPLTQRYNTFGIGVNIKDTNSKNALDYNASLGFYNLNDNFDARENGFNLGFNLSAPVTDQLSIFGEFDGLFTNYEDVTDLSRNLSKVKGGANYRLGQLLITGAANVVFSNDTISNANDFRIYPHAIAEYQLSRNWIVEGGITGDLESVTLQSLSKENPFLASSLPLFHSNKEVELYGKLSGSISRSVGLSGGVSFSSYENLYFFTDTLQFDLTYDTDATDVLSLFASLNLNLSDVFDIRTNFKFFNYNTKSIPEAWHRPTLVLNNHFSYQITRDINVRSSLTILSGVKALNPTSNESESLDAIVDLGLGGDYQINRNLSAFFQADNLLGNEYERFFSYPNRSVMIHLGATYSF